MIARAVALFFGGVSVSACFQSDFVLYGPACVANDRDDCADVVGDGGERRVCFVPDPSAEEGYCSVRCDPADASPCAPHGELEPRCLERKTKDGGSVAVCALVCAKDDECPAGMTCEPDPAGGSSSLCMP